MSASHRPTLPVLVIEDEPAVMAFVQAALERGGYSVAGAESGARALEMLGAGGQFLGIVSDMRTPGGVDGAGVHEWLITNRPELAARLLFITGDIVSEETAATLRRTGAPCIEKPFRVQDLVEIVARTFGGA